MIYKLVWRLVYTGRVMEVKPGRCIYRTLWRGRQVSILNRWQIGA